MSTLLVCCILIGPTSSNFQVNLDSIEVLRASTNWYPHLELCSSLFLLLGLGSQIPMANELVRIQLGGSLVQFHTV